MTKPELGVKRRCLTCGASFYDLSRTPVVCPKCHAVFNVPEPLPPRPPRPRYRMGGAPVVAPVPEVETEAQADDDETNEKADGAAEPETTDDDNILDVETE